MKAAIRDLREVHAYIAAEDAEAAARVVAKLDRAVTIISERPQIGRPTSLPAIREWSVPGLPYVIPYRVSGDTLSIIRFFHTSRERPPAW